MRGVRSLMALSGLLFFCCKSFCARFSVDFKLSMVFFLVESTLRLEYSLSGIFLGAKRVPDSGVTCQQQGGWSGGVAPSKLSGRHQIFPYINGFYFVFIL